MHPLVRRTWIHLLCLQSAVCLLSDLRAQSPPDIRFRRLSLEAGLSQSTVNCILQDREGFLWFGTQDGLNRYDGSTFTTYRHNDKDSTSLADNYVTCLIEDAHGDVWVGTYGSGVDRFDRQREIFVHHLSNPADSTTIAGNSIMTLLEEPNGTVWAGSWGEGLSVFDPSAQRWHRVRPAVDGAAGGALLRIMSLASDTAGNIWIGAWGGIDCYHPARGTVRRYVNDKTPGSLSENRVMSMFVDRDGTLWAGTFEGGINRLNPDRSTFTRYGSRSRNPLPSDWVGPIAQDRTGRLWIGTRDAGVTLLDPRTGETVQLRHDDTDDASLSGDCVVSLLADKNGGTWVGVNGGGANHYHPRRYKFQHLRAVRGNPQSLSSPHVRGLAEGPDGLLWIGLFGGGLDAYDRRTGRFLHLGGIGQGSDGLASLMVTTLTVDSRGTVWIGTSGGGLNQYDPRRGRFRRIATDRESISGSAYVMALCETRDGKLWVGTSGGGLLELDRTTLAYRRVLRRAPGDGLSGNFIYALLEDRSGLLWIGTWGAGVSVYDRRTDTWRSYRHQPGETGGPGNNTILVLHETRGGTVWLGTEGGGIARYDRARDQFTRYTESDGLSNNTVYGILDDTTGSLWLSTNRGICRFDPARGTFHAYTLGDGLQSLEFNQSASAEGADGTLFFGGINGVNLFHPADMKADSTSLPLHITRVRVGDREVRPVPRDPGHLDLTYDDNAVSFEFALLDFRSPEANSYRYRLEGLDRDWLSSTRGYASYANLGSGEYTFAVQARSSEGVWSSDATRLRLVVHPPFWEALWFRASVLMSIVAVGFLVYRNHLRRLDREQSVQTEFSRKLNAFQEGERKRIAGELHDSLGQELLTIKNSVLRCGSSVDPGTGLSVDIREIADAVQRTIESVREISADLHPHMLDRLGLRRTIEATLRRSAESSGMSLRSDLQDLDGCFAPQVEINIYRIIQEGVNNALKHSQASECLVVMRRNGQLCEIVIEDDGCGFAIPAEPREAVGGFGLANMAERVRLLEGRMTVTTAPGNGTRLLFHIPLLRSRTEIHENACAHC